MLRRAIVLMFFFFLALKINGQISPPAQQLDNSNGLSNGSVNHIFQDSDNLLWIGTWDGLNVFDGSEFHVFGYDNRKGSLLNNVTREIAEDRDKNIWVCTEQGVSYYSKKTGNFKNYFYDRNKSKMPALGGFLLAVDKEGDIFTAPILGSDIYKFNQASDNFERYIARQTKGKIAKLGFDDTNKLWLLCADGSLELLQKKNGGFHHLKTVESKNGVNNFFFINHKIFITTPANQLFELDNAYNSRFIIKLPQAPSTIGYYNGHYLLGWPYKGLQEYDDHFNPLSSLIQAQPGLKSMRITFIKQNEQGSLWIGTDGSGIINIPNPENRFSLINKLPDKSPFNIPVRTFCQMGNELLVGTRGNGILKIKGIGTANAQFSTIKLFNSQFDSFDNTIYAIIKGSDNLVYIGSDTYGITVYDTQKNKFITWQQIKGSNKYPLFNTVQCLLNDKDGSIWAGTITGLFHIKFQQDIDGNLSISYLEHYSYNGTNNGPANDVIFALATGKNKTQLYIGCRYGGLSIFNKKTHKFTTFKAYAYKGSLSNNDVLSLYYDQQNQLWIGTSFGLNWIKEDQLNQARPVFGQLDIRQGLPNNTIHAITGDNKNNIWVSTNKGLAVIYPDKKEIVKFKIADGLQSNEFSDDAVYKSPDGVIYFGGNYGFNYFSPERLSLKNEQPNLLITDLTIGDKKINENGLYIVNARRAGNIPQFVIQPQTNRFELKLNSITVENQGTGQYYYQLEGLDQNWQILQDDRKISYAHVPPGNYTLKVKWANSNTGSSVEKNIMTLDSKQYIWLTVPAYMFYAFLIGLSIYFFYLYNKNKLVLSHKLTLEQAMREKDNMVHQDQLDFFTNIAHELQTPLTLLGSALELHNIKSKNTPRSENGKQTYLSIANQQSNRLGYLVYQLLEFRKAEAGYLKCTYNYYNISDHLQGIADLFKPLAEHYQLFFNSSIGFDINLWMDRDKFEKIIFNLLSNAFKHTPRNNEVRFTVDTDPTKQQLRLIVANSGAHLTKHDLKEIFKKFHIIGHSHNKTGIGLAFARELTILLQGDITVTSVDNWVTFTITLPLSLVPDKENIASEQQEYYPDLAYTLRGINAEHEQADKTVIVNNNAAALIDNTKQGSSKSILIVDDESSMRLILRDILKDDYLIFEAANGNDAIQIMRNTLPNLILSDVSMPDMDGLELCTITKDTPETCHIPFILLSAKSNTDHQTIGYEAGADAYIAKPFNTELLLVRIKKLLQYHEKVHTLMQSGQSIANVTGIKSGDKKFIQSITTLINENLELEHLDATFLEQALGISRMPLYRKVKSLFNMTPGELIKNMRLQQSALLLQSSDLTVIEIFYKSGFNNESHFYREFKKKYTQSPNEYRAQQRLPAQV